jgi:hypothetical protein
MHAEPYGEWDYQSLPPSPPPHRPRFRRRSSTGSWCPVTRLRPRRIVRSLLPLSLSLSLRRECQHDRIDREERERERERERDSLPTRPVPPLSLALSHAVFARENQEEGEGGGRGLRLRQSPPSGADHRLDSISIADHPRMRIELVTQIVTQIATYRASRAARFISLARSSQNSALLRKRRDADCADRCRPQLLSEFALLEMKISRRFERAEKHRFSSFVFIARHLTASACPM